MLGYENFGERDMRAGRLNWGTPANRARKSPIIEPSPTLPSSLLPPTTNQPCPPKVQTLLFRHFLPDVTLNKMIYSNSRVRCQTFAGLLARPSTSCLARCPNLRNLHLSFS